MIINTILAILIHILILLRHPAPGQDLAIPRLAVRTAHV